MTRFRRVAPLAIAIVLLAPASCTNRPTAAPTTATSSPAAVSSSPAVRTTRPSALAGDWPVYHHDGARTGVSSDQAAAGKIRRAWQSPVLDGEIYAQPLVAGGRVYTATEGNSVYALDAATGKAVWRRALGSPVPGGSLPCGNISPSGITGTPAIDVATRTLYVVAFVRSGPHHELYALDTFNGAVRWHRRIDPPGLSARVEQQRGAVTLARGRVYVPFGGLYGDCGPYKGAIVSVRRDGQGSATSYVVPTSREAGIWTPAGAVTDGADLWVSTGNSASRGSFDYGNAVLRLSSALKVRDWFAPSNWVALNRGDVDLGSVAPVLLSSSRAFATGKEGVAYLLDRSSLGHIGGELDRRSICSRAFGQPAVLGARLFVSCENTLVGMRWSPGSIVVSWKSGGAAGPPIVAARLVWTIRYDGTLNALDPSTGRVRFSSSLPGHETRFASPSAADGRIYAPGGSRITAYSLR